MAGYGMSLGCACCGCDLWSADFSFSLVDEKPADRQYYKPLDRVGIREGQPGHGLLYELVSSQRWDIRGQQYTIPFLDSHPDPAVIGAMLIGETGLSNGTYTYKALLDGVPRYYRIDAAGTVTLLAIGAFILPTLEFDPWQDLFEHELTAGGDPLNSGVMLELNEELRAINRFPSSPWFCVIDFAMAAGSAPLTKTPFWLFAEDTGLQLRLVDEGDNVVAEFTLERKPKPAAGTKLEYGLTSDWGTSEELGVVRLTAIVNGAITEQYWPAGMDVRDDAPAMPDPRNDIYRLPITLFHVPGMIGLQVDGDAVGADSLDVADPYVLSPGGAVTWPVETDGRMQLQVRAVGEPSIITPLQVAAGRMPTYSASASGESISIIGHDECDTEIVCPLIYPHGHQRFTLSGVSCGTLIFSDDVGELLRGCDPILQSRYIGDTLNASLYPNLVANGFRKWVFLDIGDPTSDPDYHRDIETVTSLGGTTHTEADISEEPHAAITCDVMILDDAEDPEFVVVRVTATLRVASVAYGYEERWFRDDFGGVPTGWEALDLAPYITNNLLQDGPRYFESESVGDIPVPIQSLTVSPVVAIAVFEVRRQRWRDELPDPINFGAAQRVSITSGSGTQTAYMAGAADYAVEVGASGAAHPAPDELTEVLVIRSSGAVTTPRTWNIEDLQFTLNGLVL